MVGVRKARNTDAWMVPKEAIWRTMPRRGLAMNSDRSGVVVRTRGAVADAAARLRVSRLPTESRRSDKAPDHCRSEARASAKPPTKRWREEVSASPLGRLEAMGVSESVARMSRTSAPATSEMGERAKVASVEAPSSWEPTCWKRLRDSVLRAVLMEEKLWR